MELWLNDFWVLTSLLQQQKDVLLCGQHNVMIWRTWKTEIQNEYAIVFNSDTAQTLHHFLWKLLSSFSRFTLIAFHLFLWMHLKKHNICVDKNLVELLPLLKRFCFFCAFVQKFNNKKKTEDAEGKKFALSPFSQNNVFILNSCLSFWKSKTHLFFFQRKVFLIFFPPHK